MNRTTLMIASVLALFVAGNCLADTLVITYSSGKTQTVVLDEPSQGISSWQFVAGTAAQQPAAASPQVEQKQLPKEQAPLVKDEKQTEKAPKSESGVRVKWNAKPIPD